MPTNIRDSVSWSEIVFAVLAGVTGVAGSYAVAGYTREFIVAPIDALVVRLTPGPIVAFVIQNVGERGHLLHIALSFTIAIGVLAGTAIVGLLVARRFGHPTAGVLLAAVLAWGVTTAIATEPTLALAAAGPVAVFTAVGSAPFSSPDHDQSRRSALVSAAGALTFVGVSIGLGRLMTTGGPASDEREPIDEEVSTLMQEAERKSLDVDGDIPGLVSTFEEFYNVDIAEFDPDLSADGWSLTVTGEVGTDVTVSFDELTDMPTERRFETLRCVGESLNGHKLDNAVWTGTPIKPLLEEADPEGECRCAMLRAEDDYFVQFPIEALEDGFLAWGMNGQALPQSHGHPVRVLVPGHWGETNVKWLAEIELLDEAMDGYWERRGWHGTGPVNTVAKLWSESMLDDGQIEVAGHAYAGTRGVDTVEVSVDGGDTWRDAELSEPLPGEDVWRQWRFEFEPRASQEVVVRAIDGDGTVQAEERSEAFPSGATGWVSKTVNMMDASSS
ncbi:Mo-co oxidoreductase dimerisation domain-containing protein [Halomicrobium zhouii]|uniref:Mo-co oxidoreductase dimerisation domain-containing protein n=1 Tax=Halomicrobium zhouii TaxID=767519 RepID=A0A1I6KJ19_9EURY|nr:molybdopterin-dependent oxidoreductase [Halomicrobium zhouii]SFR91048.1 Mo-co oxidoreductase dimerisation domain-containing protein [Halomicrobium zhouii]